RPGVARAVGEAVGPAAALPARAGRRDQLVHARGACLMAARALAIEPQSLEVRITTMRRRHLRSVLRIENEVYPRPWTLGLFMSELAIRSGRIYLVARIGPTVVGYAGMLFSVDDGHVTTIAVDPAWHRGKIGTRLLLHLLR